MSDKQEMRCIVKGPRQTVLHSIRKQPTTCLASDACNSVGVTEHHAHTIRSNCKLEYGSVVIDPLEKGPGAFVAQQQRDMACMQQKWPARGADMDARMHGRCCSCCAQRYLVLRISLHMVFMPEE